MRFIVFSGEREYNIPNALSTVYEKVLPRTISHCADMSSATQATKHKSPTKTVWFEVPRKPIIARETVRRLVAKPPMARGD